MPQQGGYEVLSELPEGMEVEQVLVDGEVFSIRWRRHPEEEFRTDSWIIEPPGK